VVVDLAVASDGDFDNLDPRVRVVRLPSTASFGLARAHAVELARAPVVAFLEEHCHAFPGWVDALVGAHQGPWACVGAEVHSMNPGVGWSDAVHLLGYSAWMPPATAGEITSAAAHNSSYRKSDLRPLLDRLPQLLLLEPLLQAELLARGCRFYLEPGARFAHQNETGFRSLRAFYWWNRCLGRVRTADSRWSLAKKIAYSGLSPFAPWLRTLRELSRAIRRGRPRLADYLRHLPRILALHYIATAGLVLGMWVGNPGDDLRFTDFELRQDTER
jgi:hypothetical protein